MNSDNAHFPKEANKTPERCQIELEAQRAILEAHSRTLQLAADKRESMEESLARPPTFFRQLKSSTSRCFPTTRSRSCNRSRSIVPSRNTYCEERELEIERSAQKGGTRVYSQRADKEKGSFRNPDPGRLLESPTQ